MKTELWNEVEDKQAEMLVGGAGIGQGILLGATGKIDFLRVGDTSNVWGSGNDVLHTEVIVQLDSFEGRGVGAVGFDLHEGDKNLPSRLGMLSVLQDAYFNNRPVGLAFWLEPGKQNGYLARIDLT